MERVAIWAIGIFILIFLAFIPLTFQVQFRLAERLSFSLGGTSGPKCYVGVGIYWGRELPPVVQLKECYG